MSTQKKLITLCFATVFTLGLAACGGGGGGGSDAPPASGMMDDDVSLEGKYIPSGTMIPVEDVPNIVITVDSGESETLAGLGTVECASDEGCSGTVVDGVLTIMGDLKIVSVDPALDSETATVLAGLAVDMLPGEPDPAIGQRMAISSAIDAARMAVAKVDDNSTDEQVEAATRAIADARVAIAATTDVPAEEKAANRETVGEIMAQLSTAKTARMAAMEAADKADEAERMVMAATAAKLYVGISPPTADEATPPESRRHAAYDDSQIVVTFGVDDDGTTADLSEDKKKMVAANYRWVGKKYTASPMGGGTYEAVVYSNVGDAKMGDKFSMQYVGANFAGGVLDESVIQDTNNTGLVAIDSFDLDAGTATYKLPVPPAGVEKITERGSFHGVSGTYFCAPAADMVCSATVAVEGLTLAGGAWTFAPTKADALVTEEPDGDYASYGWWLHKSADGNTFTASAFVDDKGAPPVTIDISNLVAGTATYSGGAAGKYALSSSTGGTNDAGHFTARAMLEADFGATESDNMITGTIDKFIGADGESRDGWSVELKKTEIANNGAIAGLAAEGTVWTIDGTAAAAAGQWSGTLKDTDDTSGVPQVATGTFYSEYGTAGKIVGGFGATTQ